MLEQELRLSLHIMELLSDTASSVEDAAAAVAWWNFLLFLLAAAAALCPAAPLDIDTLENEVRVGAARGVAIGLGRNGCANNGFP